MDASRPEHTAAPATPRHSGIAAWLEHQWTRVSAWHLLLTPLAALFWLGSAARRLAYAHGIRRVTRLPVPVVVVGNINVGGTGKTPLTIYLAELLREAGYRPGVVSRGYGAALREATMARAHSDPARLGDEPVLIAQRAGVPVMVGVDRARAALKLLDAHPQCDVVICDDGLQHYALARDVEITVIDGGRGLGNGMLIPAGPLREGKRRLASVDAVVVNLMPGQDPVDALPGSAVPCLTMRLAGQVFYNVRDPEMRARAADFKGKTLHAVAGIGNPQRFFAHLASLGLEFVAHPFPDHYAFRADDLAVAPGYQILMTEKDAVKCRPFARENWWALAVTAEVDARLADIVLNKLRRTYGPKAA